jgi:hypothetical protein
MRHNADVVSSLVCPTILHCVRMLLLAQVVNGRQRLGLVFPSSFSWLFCSRSRRRPSAVTSPLVPATPQPHHSGEASTTPQARCGPLDGPSGPALLTANDEYSISSTGQTSAALEPNSALPLSPQAKPSSVDTHGSKDSQGSESPESSDGGDSAQAGTRRRKGFPLRSG